MILSENKMVWGGSSAHTKKVHMLVPPKNPTSGEPAEITEQGFGPLSEQLPEAACGSVMLFQVT